jgi:hypothetical protein
VGWASNNVARPAGLAPLTVVLDLDVTNGAEEILGTVSAGTNWTAALQAERATYNTSNNPFINTGNFTMVFASTNSGAQSPGGDGYATVRVTPTGFVYLNGVLSDNASVAPSAVSVSKDGWWPLYIPLYGRFGSLIGWIDFTNTGVNIVDLTSAAPCSFVGSNVMWFRTNADGKFYTNGFTNSLTVEGSVFAASNSPVLLNQPTLEVLLGGGDLPGLESNSVIAAASGKFTANGAGIPGLTLSVNPATGLIRGGFSDPSLKTAAPIKGVVFQDQINGAGFFLGLTNSGSFLLTPL